LHWGPDQMAKVFRAVPLVDTGRPHIVRFEDVVIVCQESERGRVDADVLQSLLDNGASEEVLEFARGIAEEERTISRPAAASA